MFTSYMNQICVLVDKVEKNATNGLDQNLLRDFIFAGLNCPGFGERQKHALVHAAGWWGSTIDMPPVNYFWPFDLIGRKHGMDNETVKVSVQLQVYLSEHTDKYSGLSRDH